MGPFHIRISYCNSNSDKIPFYSHLQVIATKFGTWHDNNDPLSVQSRLPVTQLQQGEVSIAFEMRANDL